MYKIQVEFLTLHNPIEYIADEQGCVKQVILQKMELGEPDGTCEKFIRRFRAMEEAAAAAGRSLSDMTLEEMTDLWNGAK